MVQTPEKLTHANKKKKSGRSYVHLETNLCGKDKNYVAFSGIISPLSFKTNQNENRRNSNFSSYDSGNKRCCTIPAAATIYGQMVLSTLRRPNLFEHKKSYHEINVFIKAIIYIKRSQLVALKKRG